MSSWMYYTSNRKHHRLRVIRLMQTSRITICRSAVRLWKRFVHNHRAFSDKISGQDRVVLFHLHYLERLNQRKCFHEWRKYSMHIKSTRYILSRMFFFCFVMFVVEKYFHGGNTVQKNEIFRNYKFTENAIIKKCNYWQKI